MSNYKITYIPPTMEEMELDNEAAIAASYNEFGDPINGTNNEFNW